MYKPAGLISTEKQETKPKKYIPYSIVTFFLILHWCFGLNYGFMKLFKSPIRLLANFVYIVLSVIILTILSAPLFFDSHFWNWISIVQFLIVFLIINTTKYDIYDFVQSVNRFGNNIPELKKEVFGVVAFTYAFFIFMIKLVIRLGRISEIVMNREIIYFYYVYLPLALGLDTISVTLLLIYCYIYCCVKEFKTRVKNSEMSVMQIKRFYFNISESYDKIITFYDRLIATELLFEIPKLMYTVFNMLWFIKTQSSWFSIVSQAILVTHIFIRILAPSIIAEMVNYEVYCAKRELHYRLLNEEDIPKCNNLLRLLRYMDVHCLEHKIWGVIPVDMRLPLSVFSLCVTYLIVIVQFAHLFD